MEQYANLGDSAGALASCRKAIELLEPLYGVDQRDQNLTSRFANVLTHAGMFACSTGDATGGLALQRRAVTMMEALAAANPDSQSIEQELLAARHWLRFALEDNNQLAEAIEQSHRLKDGLQKLVAADSKNALFRRNLSVTCNILGRQFLLAGNLAAALENHQLALTIDEEVIAANPESAERKADLAVSLWRMGEAQTAQGQYESALQNLRKALALREPVIAANPTNSRARDDVASIHAAIGKALAATGDFSGAIAAYEKAIPLAEEVSKQAPTNAKYRARLAQRYAELGRLPREFAAAQPGASKEHLQRARHHLARSAAVWQELREKKILLPADAHKPDEVARELVICEAALSAKT